MLVMTGGAQSERACPVGMRQHSVGNPLYRASLTQSIVGVIPAASDDPDYQGSQITMGLEDSFLGLNDQVPPMPQTITINHTEPRAPVITSPCKDVAPPDKPVLCSR